MNEQPTLADLIAVLREIALARRSDDDFMKRYREAFDRAESAKRENNRRLEARLAELRAQRAAG